MKVILNRWLGDKFENNAVCYKCENLASVVEVFESKWICAVCLHKAQQAISDAIIDDVVKGESYER